MPPVFELLACSGGEGEGMENDKKYKNVLCSVRMISPRKFSEHKNGTCLTEVIVKGGEDGFHPRGGSSTVPGS